MQGDLVRLGIAFDRLSKSYDSKSSASNPRANSCELRQVVLTKGSRLEREVVVLQQMKHKKLHVNHVLFLGEFLNMIWLYFHYIIMFDDYIN